MKHVSGGVTVWHRGYDYAQDGNRLLATSLPGDDVDDPQTYSDTYAHDVHGSMTAMPSIPGGLTWDPQDRLQKTDHQGGGVTYYVYDSAGMRVRKVHLNQAATTSKERYYLGPWETYRETTDLQGTPTLDQERETLHVHTPAGAVVLLETKTVENATALQNPTTHHRYQHSNHLGTATLELSEDAEVITYEEYHPYGTSSYRAANAALDVSPKRYRYTGKERDEETGLYYHEARYYACWLARWTAADPIGLQGGINRFAYANSNPLTFTDPAGTSPERAVRDFVMRRIMTNINAMPHAHSSARQPPREPSRALSRGGVKYSHDVHAWANDQRRLRRGEAVPHPVPSIHELVRSGAQVLDLGFGTAGSGTATPLRNEQKFVTNPSTGKHLDIDLTPGAGVGGLLVNQMRVTIIGGTRVETPHGPGVVGGIPIVEVVPTFVAITPGLSPRAETRREHEQSHYEQDVDLAVLAARDLAALGLVTPEDIQRSLVRLGGAHDLLQERFHAEVARAHTLHGPDGERDVISRWRTDREYRWAQASAAWKDAGTRISDKGSRDLP